MKINKELFHQFFTEVGKKYVDVLVSGQKYIIVDLDELKEYDENLALMIIDKAKFSISVFKEALTDELKKKLESNSIDDFDVGFNGECIPKKIIHEISSTDFGKLIKIRGFTSRIHDVKPMATVMAFRCPECFKNNSNSTVFYIPQISPFNITTPSKTCPDCGNNVQYLMLEDLSEYVDSQEFSLQESHEDCEGRIPQLIHLITTMKHLINMVYVGENIEVVGLVKLMPTYRFRNKSRFFTPYIEIIDIYKDSKNPENITISPEEEQQIIALSKEEGIYEKMIYNITPSIIGMEKFKEAILLVLFGGVQKIKPDVKIRGNIHICCVGDGGLGKALDINTPIPTFEGWKLMKDIKTGDKVFDENGNICNVVATTDVMYNHNVYAVKFDDGSIINADENHLWLTSTIASRASKHKIGLRDKIRINDYRTQTHKRINDNVLTTKQILETLYVKENTNHSIQLSKPLNLPNITLPINPYVLGVWLGDGTACDGSLTSNDIEVIYNIQKRGYVVRKQNKKYGYGILGLNKQLRENNLLKNKHIPLIYLRGSVEQRLELLRGLMDTDGTISSSGLSSFDNINKQLVDNVYELLCSLGIKPHKIIKMSKINGKECGLTYRLNFTTSLPIFSLQRKKQRLPIKTSKVTKNRYIVSIDKIDSVPVKCIMVDSPNHLYLCGKSMIPTHNSQILNSILSLAPKSSLSVGEGISGAGLTAACTKDEATGEFVIEAGTLVLANKGIALVDEIDKMRPEDRQRMHEALEQGIVTIHKGGKHVQLNANMSLIAVGNPIGGRYDTDKSVFENVKFPPTLWSRFDLIFVVIDNPNQENDARIAEHVINNANNEPTIDRKLFRKYIAYAKRFNPVFSRSALEKLEEHYLRVRNAMSINQSKAPINTRQLEGLVRLSEAHARALLKKKVDESDAEAAIKLFNKYLEDINFDIDCQMCGESPEKKTVKDNMEGIFKQLSIFHPNGVPHSLWVEEAKKSGIEKNKALNFIKEMYDASMILISSEDYNEKFYKKAF